MKLRLPILLSLWVLAFHCGTTFAADPEDWVTGGALVTKELTKNIAFGGGDTLIDAGKEFITGGDINVTGGYSAIFSGGAAEGIGISILSGKISLSKNIWVKFDGGNYNNVAILNGANAKLTGNLNIWVANGSLEKIALGDSAYDDLKGNLNIRISGGTVKLIGSSWQSNITGDISILIDGSAVVGDLNMAFGRAIAHGGNVIVNIGGGTVGQVYTTTEGVTSDPIIAFSTYRNVAKNTELHISDGLVKSNYITMGAHIGSGTVAGDSIIKISGGTVQSNIWGLGMSNLTGNLDITLSGGTLGVEGQSRAITAGYTGGNASAGGKTLIKLDGGTTGEGATFLGDYKILAAPGRGTGTVKGGTEIALSNVTVQNADGKSGVANFTGLISGASEAGAGVATGEGIGKALIFSNYKAKAQARFTYFDTATVKDGSRLVLTNTGNANISTWSLEGESQMTVSALAALGGASSVAVAQGSTFTLEGGDATAPNVTGAGIFEIKVQSGKTITLGELGQFTGTLALTSGTTALTNATPLKAAEVNFNGGTLDLQGGTLSAVLKGTGSLTKSTSGIAILSGTGSTYSGAIDLREGTLQAGIDQALGTGGVTYSQAGATLDLNGKTAGNKITVSADGILKNASRLTGDLTLSGGTLTLTGAATSGKLTLTGGTLAGDSLTAASYDLQNGTIQSALGGTGNAAKSTTGKVTLSGINTYSGATVISAGELELTGSITASAVSVENSAILNINGGSITRNITLSKSATLKTNSGYTLTNGQTLSGGHIAGTRHDIIGSLTTTAGSTLQVNGNLSLDGSLTLGGGNLVMGKENSDKILLTGDLDVTGATTITLTGYTAGNEPGIYTLGAFTGQTGDLNLLTAIASGTLTVRTNYALSVTGGNTLTLTVTKDAYDLTWSGGKGNWELAGSREWDLAQGVTGDRKFYNYDNVTFDSNSTVTLVGEVLPGNVRVTGSETVILQGSGSITGTGTLTKDGTGTLTLNASNSYSGGTIVKGGIVNAGGIKSFGSGAITLEGGTLALGAYAVANAINATGGTLSGTAYKGILSVTGGNLALGAETTAGQLILTGGALTGGTLNASSYDLRKGSIGTILDGDGVLTKDTADQVALNGANTYTGGTIVKAGELIAGHAGALGSGAVTLQGGTLTLGSSAVANAINATGGTLNATAYTGTLTVSGSGTLTLGNSTTAGQVILGDGRLTGGSLTNTALILRKGTADTTLTGTASVTKDTADKVTLGGSHTYTGNTLVNAGELELTGNITASKVTIADNATLTLNGGNISKDITLGSLATINTGNGGLSLSNGQTLTAGHAAGTTRNDITGSLATTAGAKIDINGTLGINGGLTLGGGTLAYSMGDNLAISGTLNVTAETTILIGSYTVGNIYTLATYTGWSGDRNNLKLSFEEGLTSRINYTLNQTGTTLTLNVTDESLTLSWKGGPGTWQALGSQQWDTPAGVSGADPRFFNDDNVIFGKGGEVTLIGNVRPGTLTVNGTENLVMLGSGSIIGTTTLLKEGNGALTLNDANAYSGGTRLTGGQINAGGVTSFGTGSIALEGGTLSLGNHAVANTVNATGGTLSGSAYAGTLNVNSGTVTLANGTHAGLVNLNGGLLTGGSLKDTAVTAKQGTLDATLTGTSTLTKETTGKVTLGGTHAHTGDTLVNAGELELTGSLSASHIKINNNAQLTLNGGRTTGHITLGNQAILNTGGGLTLANGQTLSAGHEAGTVRNDINGSLTTATGSLIDVNGTLGINGSLTLNGGTLAFGNTGDGYDRLDVTGSLKFQSATALDIAVTTQTGDYLLFTAGSISNWDTSLLYAKNKYTRTTYTFENREGTGIILHVTNKSLEITWDGHRSWTPEEDPNQFHNGDTMIFDTGVNGASDTVDLADTVEPVRVIVRGDKNLSITGEGTITGAGTLEKNGTGTLTLDTANSYTGGTILNQGGLKITDDDALGTGGLTIAAGGEAKTLTLGKGDGTALNQAGDITNNGGNTHISAHNSILGGNLSNNGSLTLGGNLTVNGNAVYTGGTITLTDGAHLTAAGGHHLAAGAALTLQEGTAEATTLAGNVILDQGTAINLGKNTALTGQITLNDGSTVCVTGDTAAGGKYTLNKGGRLDIAVDTRLTADVTLTGQSEMTLQKGAGVTGTLTVKDDSRLHITGDTARTGTVTLTGNNQLNVDRGAVVNSDLRLTHGASLDMNNGMTLGGNLRAATGSTIHLYDYAAVNGSYTIEDAGIPLGRNTEGNVHTLYYHMTDALSDAATGAPVLTLNGTLTAQDNARLRIIVDISQVNRNTSEDYTVGLISSDINAYTRETLNNAEVRVIDEDGWSATLDGNSLAYLNGKKALIGAGDGNGGLILHAPTGLGEIVTNSLWATAHTLTSFAETTRNRLHSAPIGQNRSQSVWAAALYNNYTLDDHGSHPGYDYSAWGYALGTDYRLSDSTTIGLAFGQTYGSNKTRHGIADIDQDTTMVSASLGTDLYNDTDTGENLNLRWYLGYGRTGNKGSLNSPDIVNDTYHGKWDDNAWLLDMRGTWSRPLAERTRLNLFAGLQIEYVNGTQNGFTLAGERSSYRYSDAALTTFRVPVGAGLDHIVNLGNNRQLYCYLAATVTPDIYREDPSVKITAKNRMWEATGSNPGKWSWQVNAGTACRITEDWSVGLGYEYEGAQRATNHAVNLNVNYTF